MEEIDDLFSRSDSVVMNRIYIAIGILLCLTSCYKEVEILERDADVFELSVSPEIQEYIYTSKDTSYTIEDPDLTFMLNDQRVEIKKISIRGQTTLDYRRKSYSVNLDNPIVIRGRDKNERKRLTNFKLISLSMDYTYINNRIAFGLLEQAGVMPLFYKYVEFKMNGETQGVYLLVEDPETFFAEEGSEYILRRGYHHGIADAEYEPGPYLRTSEEYVSRFKEIYTQLPKYQGSDLYEAITQRVDLNQYFRKMGIDFLLQNGDNTDEVYFYALVEKETIRYKIIPWDYDDIFDSHPHEVGVSWGTGKIFGSRYYKTQQDIYNEIGDKMIFSIEDDLDYAIAKDSLLYARYESTLAQLISLMDGDLIESLFAQVEKELTPFYKNEDLILQSNYDLKSTSLELWQSNMKEKQALVESRLKLMKSQLNYHTNSLQP